MKPYQKYLAVLFASLFLQVLHWLIFQWTQFSSGFLWITPLLLCAVYHFFQSDSSENRGISRFPVFLFGILFPLLLSILVSLAMFLHNPDMSLYHDNVEKTNSIWEIIALYSGRVTLTSLYLLIFSGLDIFLLRLDAAIRQKHRTPKETRQ